MIMYKSGMKTNSIIERLNHLKKIGKTIGEDKILKQMLREYCKDNGIKEVYIPSGKQIKLKEVKKWQS